MSKGLFSGSKIKDDHKTIYVCDCCEMSHSMRIIFDEDTDFEFCYIEFGMKAADSHTFLSRVWEGLKGFWKYVFGGEYPFTELLFNRYQVEDIKNHIEDGLKRKPSRPGRRVKMDKNGKWQKK